MTSPIVTLGVQMATSSMARRKPTASASMLVATLSVTSVSPREGSRGSASSEARPERIMRTPTKESSASAIQ